MADGGVGSGLGMRTGPAQYFDANGRRLDQYGRPINGGMEAGFGTQRGSVGYNINTDPNANKGAFAATSFSNPATAQGAAGYNWSMAPRDTATDAFNEGENAKYTEYKRAGDAAIDSDPLRAANKQSISTLLADPEAINDSVQAQIQAKQAGMIDAGTSAQRRQGMGVLSAGGQMDAGSIAAMNERLGRSNMASREGAMSDLEVTRANQRNQDIMNAQNQASGRNQQDMGLEFGQQDREIINHRDPSDVIPLPPMITNAGGAASGSVNVSGAGGAFGQSDLDFALAGPRSRGGRTERGTSNFSGGGAGSEYTNKTMEGGSSLVNQPWNTPLGQNVGSAWGGSQNVAKNKPFAQLPSLGRGGSMYNQAAYHNPTTRSRMA